MIEPRCCKWCHIIVLLSMTVENSSSYFRFRFRFNIYQLDDTCISYIVSVVDIHVHTLCCTTVCGWCVQFCKIKLCLFITIIIIIRNVVMSYTQILSCLCVLGYAIWHLSWSHDTYGKSTHIVACYCLSTLVILIHKHMHFLHPFPIQQVHF